MSRVGIGVIVGLVVVLGLIGIANKKSTPAPKQQSSRLVRLPADRARGVIVPPCGTGANAASADASTLLKTSGTISFRVSAGNGDRLALVPRCGQSLPSAAFLLPIGTQQPPEKVESQLAVPANSPIETVVVPRCIESSQQAEKNATGRTLILGPARSGGKVALAPPC